MPAGEMKGDNINELAVCLECRVISYDKESCILKGEIVNVSVDESALTDGKVDVAKVQPIRGNNKLLVNQRILCLSPNRSVISDYLLYYLRSDLFRNDFFSNETGGVNQGNVSSKFVESIEVLLPSLKEQQEIVRIINRLIENETAVLWEAKQAITHIDTIKKSILARAFRGELGTNNPADESAEELLKTVLSEKG